jgi:serine O-acetyltransferase
MYQHPELPLRQLLKEDWETHDRSATMPGLHALAVHRLQVALDGRGGLPGKVVRRVLHLVNTLVIRNLYGVEIYQSTIVGRRVRIAHHMGVILGANAVIGDDCLIRQQVTLGQLTDDDHAQPVIGRGVQFGPGSTVAGGVTVGAGAIIGAHALVLKNVPTGATAMVSPARLLPAPSDRTTA